MRQHEDFEQILYEGLKPELLNDIVGCITKAHQYAMCMYPTDRVGYRAACGAMGGIIDRNLQVMIDSSRNCGLARICCATDVNNYPYPAYVLGGKLIFHIKKVSYRNEMPSAASMRLNNAALNQTLLFAEEESGISHIEAGRQHIYGIMAYTHDRDNITSLSMGFPKPASEGWGWIGRPVDLLHLNNVVICDIVGRDTQPTGPDELSRPILKKASHSKAS